MTDIRQDLPRVGTRKLLHLLHPQLGEHAPRVGRDLIVQQAEQVWVSDITYVRLLNGWSYLSLVTDLYPPP